MKEAKGKITQIYNRYRSRKGVTGTILNKMTKTEHADGVISELTKEIDGVIHESARHLTDDEMKELTEYAADSIKRFSGITKVGL